MTIFKTYLKLLNKNKFLVIMYTVILITFGGMNMKTKDNNISFQAVKPDIVIINNDKEVGITKDLINYIKDNSKVVDIENNEDKINDALFYREVNYVIYIPEKYNEDFMNKKNPEIKIKSSGDYQASYAEMILERYIEVANRKGIIEQFPLVSLSIGVVVCDIGRFHNILEIGEVGAQVKHAAKSVMGSCYAVDRRK